MNINIELHSNFDRAKFFLLLTVRASCTVASSACIREVPIVFKKFTVFEGHLRARKVQKWTLTLRLDGC